MEPLKLCASDYKFMTVVWKNEPVHSGELVKICQEELGWKKSTTYTMVKKLEKKGFLKNENSVVRACIPRKKVQAFESEYIVNHAFEGSLPAFIASFISNRRLSEKEITEIKRLIDDMSEE